MRNFFGSTFKIHLISDHFNHATIVSHLEMASASWVGSHALNLLAILTQGKSQKFLKGFLLILILHSLTHIDDVLEQFLPPGILGQCFCIFMGSPYQRSLLWPTQTSKAAAATLLWPCFVSTALTTWYMFIHLLIASALWAMSVPCFIHSCITWNFCFIH